MHTKSHLFVLFAVLLAGCVVGGPAEDPEELVTSALDGKEDGYGRSCDARYLNRGCPAYQQCRDYDKDGVGHCVAWRGAACLTSTTPDACVGWYGETYYCLDTDRDGGGFCAVDPTMCRTDASCGYAKACRDWDGDGRGHCVDAPAVCETDFECALELQCADYDADGVGHCVDLPGCKSHAQCARGSDCMDYDGDRVKHCVPR